MPLDPLQFVAHYESSGNPTAHSPSTTASGLVQFLDSTWSQYASQVPGAASYAHAADAPASVQAAVFAADYNANGFSHWTCSGCNARLTQALSDLGGPSAFAPQGTLSTDPAVYSALNSGFNSYFASHAAGADPLNATGAAYGTSSASVDPGYDPSLTPGSLTQALGTASAIIEDPSFAPFAWIMSRYDSAIQQPLDRQTQLVIDKAGGVSGLLVVIAIAAIGIAVCLGLKSHHDIVRKFLKGAVVVAALSSGGLYQTILVPLVNSVPSWMSGTGNSSADLSVATPFDKAIDHFVVMSSSAMAEAHGFKTMAIVLGLIILAGLFLVPALALMFAIFFSAKIVSGILLVLGAFLVLTLLSDYTERIFFSLINHFIGLALLAFAAIIIASLAVNLVDGVFDAVPHATTSVAIGSNLVAAVIAILAVGFSLAVLWKTVEHLTASAGHAQLTSSAQNAVSRAVSRGVAAAAGGSGAAANVVSMRRSSSMPVGRSLSGGP